MTKQTLFVIFVFTLTVAGLPSRNEPYSPKYKNLGIQTFDSSAQLSCTAESDFASVQNGLSNQRFRWKNFNVQPDRVYSRSDVQKIRNAMARLQQYIPCVKFGIWPQNSRPRGDYVFITNGTGCSATVGRQGGKQAMSLKSPGCMSESTIMHEMIHSLGFHHEHCREDRDEYITVHENNINKTHLFNFNKVVGSNYSTFGVRYNQLSIMHYKMYDFSIQPGVKPSITAKNGGQVGSNILQDTDIEKLKRMYQCEEDEEYEYY